MAIAASLTKRMKLKTVLLGALIGDCLRLLLILVCFEMGEASGRMVWAGLTAGCLALALSGQLDAAQYAATLSAVPN